MLGAILHVIGFGVYIAGVATHVWRNPDTDLEKAALGFIIIGGFGACIAFLIALVELFRSCIQCMCDNGDCTLETNSCYSCFHIALGVFIGVSGILGAILTYNFSYSKDSYLLPAGGSALFFVGGLCKRGC